MSGVTPSAACAPPGDTRNPVTTSSKISTVPLAVLSSRSRRRKSGRIGIRPKLAPVGSMMTAAISRCCSKIAVTPAASFGSASSTSSATPASTPVVGLPSKWFVYPLLMWSCQPWKCPRNRNSFVRPVAARANRNAISVASVPEDVNRTRSALGTMLHTRSAQRTSSSWHAP